MSAPAWRSRSASREMGHARAHSGRRIRALLDRRALRPAPTVAAPDERSAQQERLLLEQLEPARLAVVGLLEPERLEALRVAVHERVDPELLREAAQLALGRGPLLQVHEVDLDAPLAEEAQRP